MLLLQELYLFTFMFVCSAYTRQKPRAIPSLSLSERDTDTVPPTLHIQVPIDHFSNDTRTYDNRYWINTTYYKPGGPVFLLDTGEENVNQDVLDLYLNEATGISSAMELVRQFGGLAVLWEHRLYGSSLPFPIDPDTGICDDGFAAYQYLTIDQALEDTVYLANHFQPPGYDSIWDSLQPSKTPWIFLGGSYPGMRAAFSRIRHPEVWYASWASSAPVETHVHMETYYETLAQDMTGNCSSDIHAAVNYFDNVLVNGTLDEKILVKALVSLASSPSLLANATAEAWNDDQITAAVANITDEDAATSLINIIPPNMQQTGFQTMLPYCTFLESYNTMTTRSASSLLATINATLSNDQSGQISTNGIAAHSTPHAAFNAVVATIYQIQLDFAAELVQFEATEGTSQSWTWQTCYELGFAQIANASSPWNIVSRVNNITEYLDQCHTYFPYPELPATPNVSAGLKYGGWNMQPSNVMFTNGLKDPWRTLSVHSTTEVYGAPMRNTTDVVPKCGQPPNGTDVFGLLYENGYHIGDLSKDFDTVNTTSDLGVALFTKALEEWLLCFHAGC